MINSIWETIKLAFGRKPQGDIVLPPKELKTKIGITVNVPEQSAKRGRKKKDDASKV